MRIGIVGAGRAGSALARALAGAGESVVALSSRSHARAEALARTVPGCLVVANAQEVADSADLVFLAVSDDAIAEVVSQIAFRRGTSVVHCSGATGLDSLSAARTQGARVGSFHPLRLLPDPQVPSADLSDCAIAVDGDDGVRHELTRLALALGARPIHIPAAARAGYHAASHYAAAFLCVLLDEGEQIFHALGVADEDARWGLVQLARSTLEVVTVQGPARAMAGVFSRGDAHTARKHVDALEALGPQHADLYRSLAARAIPIAVSAGRIDDTAAERLSNAVDAQRNAPQ